MFQIEYAWWIWISSKLYFPVLCGSSEDKEKEIELIKIFCNLLIASLMRLEMYT